VLRYNGKVRRVPFCAECPPGAGWGLPGTPCDVMTSVSNCRSCTAQKCVQQLPVSNTSGRLLLVCVAGRLWPQHLRQACTGRASQTIAHCATLRNLPCHALLLQWLVLALCCVPNVQRGNFAPYCTWYQSCPAGSLHTSTAAMGCCSVPQPCWRTGQAPPAPAPQGQVSTAH
jgi:hypothetical protein